MGVIEKYLNVTMDTGTAVSKRSVFGNCVNGTWEWGGALCWFQRLLGFMRESKIFWGKVVCSSFKWDLYVYSA
jgi:hypothetical protein